MITAELIDRLVDATNEAKATLQECHGARRDLRVLLKDVDEKLGGVRAEVQSTFSEMSETEWNRVFDEVNITKMAAGLKQSFDKWLSLLTEAQDVLDRLNARAGKVRL